HQYPVALARTRPERQLDGEGGPLARGALEVDRSAVQFDQLLGERQPQSGARVLPVVGTLHLVEGAEDLVLQFSGDPDTTVPNGDAQELIVSPRLDRHLSGRRGE